MRVIKKWFKVFVSAVTANAYLKSKQLLLLSLLSVYLKYHLVTQNIRHKFNFIAYYVAPFLIAVILIATI